MKNVNLAGCVCLSVVLSVTANAACGGGKFNAPKPQERGNTVVQQSSSSTVTGRNSNAFDVSGFHSVSGQLHLTGEQATTIINAIQEIRAKMDASSAPPKDFDPKREFETRLSTILNPEQMRTYQGTKKV